MRWRRSTRCDSSNCVEVAILNAVEADTWVTSSECESSTDLSCVEVQHRTWAKSSLSGANGGCVDVSLPKPAKDEGGKA